jgi:asparagine synthase (glutamine-hydrolysing)
MCGIFGAIKRDGYFDKGDYARFMEATDLMIHRGPDDEGYLAVDLKGRRCDDLRRFDLFLGHRRLAIIDLSSAGKQPMLAAGNRYQLIFNGEIYNYLELRSELKSRGHVFFSDTDTEVLLTCLTEWGRKAFAKLNGMWALAFVDLKERSVLLSRDRFGIKPLYVLTDDDAIYFASEVKAICRGARKRFPVNAKAVARFIGQSLLDAQEETFFTGIIKLAAGHCLEMSLGHDGKIEVGEREAYWEVPDEGLGIHREEELVECIKATFLDAVSLRLRSDVPVGVLLSGGVDSSGIVGAVQALKPAQVPRVISAVSADDRYNEEPYIDRVGNYFDLEVSKVKLEAEPKEAFDLLERATWFNDEPVGSFSSVAHYMLMEKAKELGVTVILSGQGADEILCGYRKYQAFYLQTLFRDRHYRTLGREALGLLRPPWPFLSEFGLGEAKRYMPVFYRPWRDSVLASSLSDQKWVLPIGVGSDGIVERQKLDLYKYSVPVLTHYEDRMSMAFSREIRLPFLDYRLVSLLVPLKARWKLRDGWTKWIFRRALQPLLPEDIVWRRDKKGFTTPIGEWLRVEWRRHVEELFGSNMMVAEWGLLDAGRLRKMYQAYCENHSWLSSKDVFNPLALEVWARQYHEYLSPPA